MMTDALVVPGFSPARGTFTLKSPVVVNEELRTCGMAGSRSALLSRRWRRLNFLSSRLPDRRFTGPVTRGILAQ